MFVCIRVCVMGSCICVGLCLCIGWLIDVCNRQYEVLSEQNYDGIASLSGPSAWFLMREFVLISIFILCVSYFVFYILCFVFCVNYDCIASLSAWFLLRKFVSIPCRDNPAITYSSTLSTWNLSETEFHGRLFIFSAQSLKVSGISFSDNPAIHHSEFKLQ